jgi:hypothetical protein
VADGRAVVHDLPGRAVAIELRDVGDADFQLERGRDAVADHHAVGVFLLSVLVKVDEAGRDDVIRRVDDAFPGERLLRQHRDLPAGDADVADGVEP